MEINKIYWTYSYSYQFRLHQIKIIKITAKKIFYENLSKNRLNYGTQIFKNNLNCLCEEKEDCLFFLEKAIDKKINILKDKIKELEKLKFEVKA